jgi:hypothetical protein
MSVSVSVKPDDKVSRMEVIIRIVYAIVLYIVAIFVMIAVYILWILNVLSCIVLAKRFGAGFLANVVEWYTKIVAYMFFVTDERPPFIPKI